MSGESMSFDEWMNPHQRECFEAGAQSRQAEIDELQKRLSEITDKCILRGQKIELLDREIYNKNQIIEACLYSDEEGEQND